MERINTIIFPNGITLSYPENTAFKLHTSKGYLNAIRCLNRLAVNLEDKEETAKDTCYPENEIPNTINPVLDIKALKNAQKFYQ